MPTDKDLYFCKNYLASVLSYTDNAASNTVFGFLKISATYDYILKNRR